MISFFVAGIPRPTQTGSVIRPGGGKRAFPLYRNTGWASYCRLVASQQKVTPLTGPVTVCLTFYLPRPKHPKSQRPIVRPDLDNLEKKLMDGWNGILWHDDAQVVSKRVEKHYATSVVPPGLSVLVWQIGGGEGR
jgi:Holliday junction resolvase RusA-like endonuclease